MNEEAWAQDAAVEAGGLDLLLTDGDFCLIEQTLDPEGRQLLLRVREFMEKPVQPADRGRS